MLGKFQPHVAQELRAVDHRVHEQVLGRAEVPAVRPAEFPVGGEHVGVADGGVRALEHLLVHVVRDNQVGGILVDAAGFYPGLLLAKVGHQRFHGLAVHPIVGIDHLVVQPLRSGQAGVHCRAVPAVGLVDSADDSRMLGFEPVADLGRVVPRGTIVDQDDLDVVAAGKQRFHALLHVVG